MISTAYRFIRYDKVKSIGVIIGIVVSIFLIGQQIGVLSFLTGLMGGLVSNSRQEIGQILVVDNITRNANELPKLNESLVRELRSIEGVMNTNLSLNQDRFDKGQINACDLITDEIDFQKELTRFNEKRAELVYKQIELINNSGALSSFIDNLR